MKVTKAIALFLAITMIISNNGAFVMAAAVQQETKSTPVEMTEEYSTISGQVKKDGDDPLSGVTALVYDKTSRKQVGLFRTNEEGIWSCDSGIVGHTYVTRIYLEGYEMNDNQGEIVLTDEGYTYPLVEARTPYTTTTNPGPVFKYETLEDNTIKVDLVEVTGFTLKIPREIDGYIVSKIGNITNSGIKTLILPDTIEELDSTTIINCTALTTVYLNTNLKKISGELFKDCVNLEKIYFPNTIEELGHLGLNSKKLTSITIPYSVTTLERAFYASTYLKEVVLPESIVTIGDYSFTNSGITDINIPDSVKKIGNNAFEACSKLTKVVIPESVMEIGDSAFQNCSNMTEVVLPDSITRLGSYAFSKCTSLEEFLYPKHVQESGIGILSGSNKITKLLIPEGVIALPDNAFYACGNLQEIQLPSTLKSIGSGAFKFCSALTTINMPDSLSALGDEVFLWCDALTNWSYPKNLTSCGANIIKNCALITDLVIPEGVTTLYEETFKDCTQLTSVSFPNTLKEIQASCFLNCKNLTSLQLPDSVEYIRDSAFGKCSGITSINYPLNLKSWDYPISSNSNCITSVTIPEGVTNINKEAFSTFKNVKEIVLPSTIKTIGNTAFGSMYKLEKINLPEGLTEIGAYAFVDCVALDNIVLPESLETIGKKAFYGCEALTSLVIPKKVTSIEDNTFNFCESLKTLTLHSNISKLGFDIFINCKELEKLFIGPKVDKTNSYLLFTTFQNANKLTLYGMAGSYIEEHAKQYNIPFLVVDLGEDIVNSVDIDLGETTKVTVPIVNYTKGVDLTTTVSQSGIVEVGQPVIDEQGVGTISLKGLQPGTTDITVTLANSTVTKIIRVSVPGKIVDQVQVTGIEDKEYTGEAITQGQLEVWDKETLLKENIDYTITYKNNIEVGDAIITLTGIGIYNGTKEVTFKILPIQQKFFTVENIDTQYYTGKEIMPAVVVKDNGAELNEGIDYSITYTNNINIGTGTVAVTGMGLYKETKEVNFTIAPRSITELTYSNISNQSYTGKAITPSVTVQYNTTKLVQGVDYTVTYVNNCNIGTATVEVKGIGNFAGTKTLTFEIVDNRVDIAKATFTNIPNQSYTGKAITPSVTVRYNTKLLVAGVDYTVSYENNCKVGTASVVIRGIGNYKGTKTLTFKIVSNVVSQINITKATCAKISNQYYTGQAIKPSVKLKYGKNDLKYGKDYKLSYSKNCNVGTATIRIQGIGNYTGTKTVSFKIIPRSVAKLTYSKISNKTYTGKQIKPSVTIKYGTLTLKNGRDYTLSYSKNVNAGTATVKVFGKGNYNGSKTITYRILPKSIAKLKFSGVKDQTYTGRQIKPSVTVKDGSKRLQSGQHYKLSYKNNTKVGTAYVIISGKGNYSGTKKIKFRINPKGTKITSVKATGSKRLQIRFQRNSLASGYQIYRSTSKTGKYTKIATIKNNRTTSYLDRSKLSARNTYYYKVRVMQKVGSTYYYSNSSAYKSGRTR